MSIRHSRVLPGGCRAPQPLPDEGGDILNPAPAATVGIVVPPPGDRLSALADHRGRAGGRKRGVKQLPRQVAPMPGRRPPHQDPAGRRTAKGVRRSSPRSGVLAVAVCLALLASCAPAPEAPRVPLRLDFPGPDPSCAGTDKPEVGPEVWERKDFRDRIANGRVEKPIKLVCISQAYSTPELERYAELGDPVAALAWTVHSYSGRGLDACSDLSAIRARLVKAYRQPNTVVPGPVSRVPEAAFILGLIENYCAPGGDAFDQFNLLTYDLGYDVAADRPPLIE